MPTKWGYLSAIAFILVGTSVQAQSEAERRKAVVPYIRASTDCIATAMRTDPDFPKAAMENNLWIVRKSATEKCIDTVVRMADAHDRFWYPGKGKEFLSIYAADLDNSLRKRLGADMARIREQNASALQARKEEAEAQRKVTAMLISKLYDCVYREAAAMIASTETADTITRAAITLCDKHLDAAIASQIKAGDVNAAEDRKEVETIIRDRVRADLVKLRATVTAPNFPPAQNSTPAKSF